MSETSAALPLPQIGRMRIIRDRPSCSRQFIFEKLHAWRTHSGSQTGHARTGSGQTVEILLGRPHVEGPADDRHPEQVAIKLRAVLRTPHGHGRMVETQE